MDPISSSVSEVVQNALNLETNSLCRRYNLAIAFRSLPMTLFEMFGRYSILNLLFIRNHSLADLFCCETPYGIQLGTSPPKRGKFAISKIRAYTSYSGSRNSPRHTYSMVACVSILPPLLLTYSHGHTTQFSLLNSSISPK